MALSNLDEPFLHRSCVQLSSALVDPTVLTTEEVNAIRFAKHHAGTHPREIARALVWRVVDSADDTLDQSVNEDRAGAWSLLTAVIKECGDANSEIFRTALGDQIAALLPYLVGYRWCTSVRSIQEEGLRSSANIVLNYDKVIPSSLINGFSPRNVDVYAVGLMKQRYRKFLSTWKSVWRPDVYQSLRDMVKRVEGQGNFLPPMADDLLMVPEAFRESLWRLRRTAPRPSIAIELLRNYGWPMVPVPRENNNTVRATAYELPQTEAALRQLDPAMHPIVFQWLRTLREKQGGCPACDYWDHTESRCPCEVPFWRSPSDESAMKSHRALVSTATGGAALPLLTYVQAARILYSANVRLPLRVPEVLDVVTRLIRDEKPYEELLAAFDTVRGAVTGPRERHALWRHASYQLLPSKTVFSKPNDDTASPSMHKIQHLFESNRRFKEWEQLSAAVDVLDMCFRRRDVSARTRHDLDEVRATASFFFCLVDGSLSASFNPATYARVPEEVEALAALKDNLCRVCLQPFHTAVNCPQVHVDEAAEYRRHSTGLSAMKPQIEEWDLQVARRVLEDADCLVMKFPAEAYRVAAAMERIDNDDRPAKDFRKAELQLAVKLIHERRVAVCPECNVTGHSLRSCERRAYRAVKHVGLFPVDVRLDPHTLRQALRRYSRDDPVYGELLDALDLYSHGGQLLPAAFTKAIREMDDARIPLAAARYATDTVQSFLLYSNFTDLLQHLRQLRSARFPEVCIFCDSLHHRSEDCTRCRADERGYLQELRRTGLTLWTYLLHRDGYDQLLPSDHARGKESVLALVDQFEKDYRPGGVGRSRFFKDNDLPDMSQGSLLTNTYASLVDSPPTRTSQERKRPREEGRAEKADVVVHHHSAEAAAPAAAVPATPSDLLGGGSGVEDTAGEARHNAQLTDLKDFAADSMERAEEREDSTQGVEAPVVDDALAGQEPVTSDAPSSKA
ncbi:hypothetical protein ABB37_07098 [Leptomonas pyrrhocoris]|uniref:CCHC-type domain-containing protein n=1 Tax=Leptomonas pyrrhocoris TaxID=157538 RepID=A0A0M9FW48_LEPPY|nr:hypothetical protein ABB37_07098 [Leptomonas pyrrhocoris]KPA77179.1 hypothetical protein ABB37_07098 [Leptomonas pyrrhocoris]|eukprot:XP_015655618.1 hypothetical protein ABB37_07098 [Leptomonas pyrrhocoris]